MDLLIYLEGKAEPDRYICDETYETDAETGELLIYPAPRHNSDMVITTYARDKWISVRRVPERGENWPVRPIEIPNTEEVENPTGDLEVGHLVRNFGNEQHFGM